MSSWRTIWRTKSENFIAEYLDEPSEPVGTGYLTIDLDALRISDVRRGLTKFYGVVHSNIAVASISGTTPEFQVVSSPPELAQLDAGDLERVIVGPIRLMNGVPYRGGGVQLEIGLFSIAAADLAQPYLKLLGSLSTKAGIAFTSEAQPFVDIIHAGFQAIAGGDSLEIGRSALLDPPRQGRYIVVRATRADFPNARFGVAPDGRQLLIDEQPANCPFMILNFRVSPARDDWFRIPELADAYSRVRGSVRDQDAEELAARLAAFRVIALTSPDLLPAHAKALYAQVEEEFCAFLPDRIGEPPRANIGLGPVTRGAGLGLEDGPKRLANFNPFAVSADGDGRVN